MCGYTYGNKVLTYQKKPGNLFDLCKLDQTLTCFGRYTLVLTQVVFRFFITFTCLMWC